MISGGFDFDKYNLMVQEISGDCDGSISVTGTLNPIVSVSQYRPITCGVDLMKAFCDYKIPKRYIINKDATILFWEDGEKTIVKLSDGDKYDKRLGFLIAYFQKHSGLSRSKANKFLDNLEEE